MRKWGFGFEDFYSEVKMGVFSLVFVYLWGGGFILLLIFFYFREMVKIKRLGKGKYVGRVELEFCYYLFRCRGS